MVASASIKFLFLKEESDKDVFMVAQDTLSCCPSLRQTALNKNAYAAFNLACTGVSQPAAHLALPSALNRNQTHCIPELGPASLSPGSILALMCSTETSSNCKICTAVLTLLSERQVSISQITKLL